jgi:outer membrane protein assembly factor BamC
MFRDRQDAGRRLAERLERYRADPQAVVLGIPRGGVVVAAVVARQLGLPLDLVVVRKIGAPGNPEYAVGAMDEDGRVERSRIARVSDAYLEAAVAENRAEMPPDVLRSTLGKVADLFYTTYKREKYHTRIERGTDPGTVDIYVASRVMEQVPTAKIDNSSPAAFAWALMPPNPGLDAEWLGRLMVRFGMPDTQVQESLRATAPGGTVQERAKLQKASDGVNQLVLDDGFDRAWRRVGLALDRIGFTVVDRDRSKGEYFVRYSDPETAARNEGLLTKLMFWKDKTEKPEQYKITVAQSDPRSIVTVQDPNGAPDKSATGEKILTLLKDQLK